MKRTSASGCRPAITPASVRSWSRTVAEASSKDGTYPSRHSSPDGWSSMVQRRGREKLGELDGSHQGQVGMVGAVVADHHGS